MPNKSQPDTFLINEMSGQPPLHGNDNNKYLLEWFAALETGDESLCRHRAKDFLEKAAEKLAGDLGVSDNRKQHLVKMFEPLDRLFISAVSLGPKGEHIREHLSHTIRNYLFSQFILTRLSNIELDKNQKILGLATIFHDIAYPIEKFKKATHGFSDAFFKDYLDSEGKVDVELAETENFLNVLDFIGSRKYQPFEYLYRWVVAPAIAGIGLFDSNHNISSTAIFIRSIFEKWGKHNTFWKDKEKDLAEICMAITFHDRKMNPFALGDIEFSCVSKALRIADELQEWGRDKDEKSYVSEVNINEHPSSDTLLSITIKLKNISDDKKCEPNRFMADKIAGLLPTIGKGDKLEFNLEFPEGNTDLTKIPNKENIITAYEKNTLISFLNGNKGMSAADIKRRIICKYVSGGHIRAEFSNHKVILTQY